MSDGIVLKKPQARIDLAGCYAYIGGGSFAKHKMGSFAAGAEASAVIAFPHPGD